MSVQLVATDSQIIHQTRKGGVARGGGGEDGGKEGVQGESAGAYPVNCSLGDEGSQGGVGVHSPTQLELVHLLDNSLAKLLKDALLHVTGITVHNAGCNIALGLMPQVLNLDCRSAQEIMHSA